MNGVSIIFKIKIGDRHKGHRRSLHIPLGPFSEQEGAPEPMGQSITLTDSQKFSLGPVTAVDKKGNPAELSGPVTFTSSDESILTVTDNGDATAVASAAGPLGNAQVVVSDGAITQPIDVTVIGGAEAGFAVPLGTPEEQ